MSVPAAVALSRLFSLEGQAAIVTGAAVGIGRAIALRLAEAGAAVLVTDVDDARGQETVALVTAAGGTARFLHADGSRVDAARAAVDACVSAFGRVDVLVNNAGIFPGAPALETTEGLWDRVLDLNLKGAFFFTQAAARQMVAAGTGGRVVNIASIDAFHPTGGLAHYDASKGGLVMLTRSLALELGRAGIRVNGVAPGGIHTPGADSAMAGIAAGLGLSAEQMSGGFSQRIPMGRMGEPDEIATVALFLATDASRYMTGQTVIVDGGYLLS